MSAVRKLRLHYKDGRTVVEPLPRFAAANGLRSLREAKDLIAKWVAAGDLRPRTDGGYDVVRFRARQGAKS
jgi:hypothetical protein